MEMQALLNRTLTLCLVFAAFTSALFAQRAKYTATRAGDLQVGVDFVLAQSDYQQPKLKGAGFYASFDFRSHLGAEVDFHQANSGLNNHLYERTYEVGPRYFRTYGRLSPYARAMYGRGVFNFPYTTGGPVANLAYNLFAAGAGVDVAIKPYLNVRADYEYQKWLSFPPHGLTPQLFTVGVAYRFPGNLQRGQHFPGK